MLEETIGSESDEETVEIIPHQVVPVKLGNAKEIDVKCQVINGFLPDPYFCIN